MLYLNKEDIGALVDFGEMTETIWKAMEIYDRKDFRQPDRIHADLSDGETYLYMPAFTEEVKGTKILTLSLGNPKVGKPVIQGVMLLNDPVTGDVVCILDGASVTGYRTGAVGATGLMHTSPEDCSTLGIVGTGVQAFYQGLYAPSVRPIDHIRVFDIDGAKAAAFAKRLGDQLPGVRVEAAASPEDLVRNSQAVITATPSSAPVIPDDAGLLKDRHFVGIGSYKPHMREYPDSLFRLIDRAYVDVDFALEESGDLITPINEGLLEEKNVKTLYQAVREGIVDRTGTTFFKTVGMALFDILVADRLYKKALESGAGQVIRT